MPRALTRLADWARERLAMARIRQARPDIDWSLRIIATQTAPGWKCRGLTYRRKGSAGWLWLAWAESADALDHAVSRITG